MIRNSNTEQSVKNTPVRFDLFLDLGSKKNEIPTYFKQMENNLGISSVGLFSLSSEIESDIYKQTPNEQVITKYTHYLSNFLKYFQNPCHSEATGGFTQDIFHGEAAFLALNAYGRLRYIIEQLKTGTPLKEIVEPFTVTYNDDDDDDKSCFQDSYLNRELYLSTLKKVARYYVEDDLLEILHQSITNKKFGAYNLYYWHDVLYKLTGDLSVLKKFVQFNLSKAVTTNDLWNVIYSLSGKIGYSSASKYNLYILELMDLFLDKDSSTFNLLQKGKYLDWVINHILEPYQFFAEVQCFTTICSKFPHIYPALISEYREISTNPRHKPYYLSIVVFTEENGDLFFSKDGFWELLNTEGSLSNYFFFGNADKIGPFILKYPHVVPQVCMKTYFSDVIDFLRKSVPSLLDPNQMALFENDNFRLLLALGYFNQLPIDQKFTPIFKRYHDVASHLMYEAAAVGDIPRFKGLQKLRADTTVQTDKHSASSTPAVDGPGLFSKTKTVHKQEVTQYSETVEFKLTDFVKYLNAKYQVTKEEERASLFFIQHVDQFVENLTESGVLTDKNRNKFLDALATTFHVDVASLKKTSANISDEEKEALQQRVKTLELENEALKKRMVVVENFLSILQQNSAFQTMMESVHTEPQTDMKIVSPK
ncbi:hypothetical protein ACNVED_06745 [Legionella sp. D16C41]|uniref:hypothetical protein n=1 Tax=Legionella sp. D16C41 TaxID=3402688 RepID=UPI003AF8C103